MIVILLASSISVAIFAAGQSQLANEAAAVSYHSNDGYVIVQLPQGTPNHPTTLYIAVSNTVNQSDPMGNSMMEIHLWDPNTNQYLPVAVLTTYKDNSTISLIQSVLNNTLAWTPPTMMNIINLTTNQLYVWMDGPMLVANLTVPITITLPPAWGGNIILPPMTLWFVPIAQGFTNSEMWTLPKPIFSGWTVNSTYTDTPAWVRVSIPTWLGPTPVETVGSMALNDTTNYIPPAS
jgi:hypothetical protein